MDSSIKHASPAAWPVCRMTRASARLAVWCLGRSPGLQGFKAPGGVMLLYKASGYRNQPASSGRQPSAFLSPPALQHRVPPPTAGRDLPTCSHGEGRFQGVCEMRHNTYTQTTHPGLQV